MSRIVVLSPEKLEEAPPSSAYAPRGPVQEGAVIALIANGKPMARELLELIADELRRRLPIGGVEIHEKKSAGVPIDADVARMLAARSRLVICGLGD